jgi:adenosylmethionine-8-amino-7-oxononanoate aminotransferase
MVEQVAAELMRRGVALVSWASHRGGAPPLLVPEADLDVAMEALDAALVVADERVVRG